MGIDEREMRKVILRILLIVLLFVDLKMRKEGNEMDRVNCLLRIRIRISWVFLFVY